MEETHVRRPISAPTVVVLAAVLAAPLGSPLEAYTSQQELLRARVERLETEGVIDLGDARIVAHRLIPALCERFEFQPAWTDPAMVEQLLAGVRDAETHGLDPSDYHLEAIESRLANGDWQSDDPIARTDLEFLLTDSLARLGFTLHFGKLDPERLDPVWNFSRELQQDDPVSLFEDTLRSGKIRQALEEIAPRFPFYLALREALVEYMAIADRGGWTDIPEGPVLKVGMHDPRVPALRARLATTGDLSDGEVADPTLYDGALEQDLMRFQQRHGIDPDGKVGPQTIEELNLPVDHRIDQIRATLERARWVSRDVEDDFLLVDIAGFKLHLYRDRKEIWSTRVQVGKPYHATPVFKSKMKYLVVNPTWTIPPGILRNETLPSVRKDPDYLKKRNMSVVTSSGTIVDPSTIDWSKPFRYSIRQEPGPHNALGRIKFIFPNEYYVYLHDTPSRGLFSRSERAFSHGCIRVQDPLVLAEFLLQDSNGWDRTAIDQTLESEKTTTVFLPEPLTVMLLYWTAEPAPDGSVIFSRDVYGRDAAIIDGLNRPFEFSPPQGMPGELSGR
jgi:murein L,D-transpeptidase YcbB/YkuD